MSINIKSREKLLNFFLEITDNDKKTIGYISNLLDVYPDALDYMIKNEMPDLSEVKWVKYKRWNMLKDKVLENLDILQLNSILNDAFPIKILKQIKNYYYDKFKDNNITHINDIILKIIKKSPYDALCRIDGIGFIKADKILLDAYTNSKDLWDFNLESSKYRCTCFILYYLINCLNGSTVANKTKIKQEMIYRYGLSDCVNSFDEAITDYRLYSNNNSVMLMSTYLEEKNISSFIHKSLRDDFKINFNINTEAYREIDSFNLSDSQMKTLELINTEQLVLLNGYAGTGKSSSIKALINMLEDNQKTYVILSPTAKAAKQISKYTDRPASTIHYLLCKEFPNFDNNNDYKVDSEYDIACNVQQFYNTSVGVLDYDVIIVDETSMLSVSLFNTLLKYIDPQRNKVLLIGDSYQLPSIQNGNLYQDLLSINEIPKVTLNEIFRYKENGLVNVATNIRLGNKYLNGDTVQNIGDSYTFYSYSNIREMLNASMNKYLDLIEAGNNIEDIAILTAKNVGNSGTYLINSCIQKVINPINEFDDYISIQIDKNIIKFKENDVVMNIKNNYNGIDINEDEDNKILIANGQIGVVKRINIFDNSMIVRIEDKDFKFSYEDIRNLRLAYCFTIHKAQGSQFKNVIYLTTSEDSFMTSSNLMYVAVTRAQENCYHYGDMNTINRKISEQENLKRNTSLTKQFYNMEVI